MARKRMNWGKIGLFGFGGCWLSFMGLILVEDAKDEMVAMEVQQASTAAVDNTTYALVNSDTIEVKKDELTHIFNFSFGHVIATGRVNETSIDAAFTFDQFGEQDRIEAVRTQGCTIAKDTLQKLSGDQAGEAATAAIGNATLFIKNHCPVMQP